MNAADVATGELMAIHPAYAKAPYHGSARQSAPGVPTSPTRLALVQIVGPQSKPGWAAAMDQVNRFAADSSVAEIIVLVDSPGGTVRGTHDLYLAVSKAAERKRVTAFIEDMGASGAYYAVCGATEIICNHTAKVGSIGVYLVMVDASRALQEQGFDVLVVRSGPYKGTAEWGARISQEEIDHVQYVVDAQARHFTAAVAKGRKMTPKRVTDLADGRTFIGQEAVAAKLVDRIATFEEVADEAWGRLTSQYLHLDGRAAVEKFDAIVAASEGLLSSRNAALQFAADKYPELAGRAAVARAADRYDAGELLRMKQRASSACG